MAHAHDHHHDGTYFLDQLCTIAVCGALGAVSILMFRASGPDGQSKLSYILAPKFFVPVLAGGIALIFLVAVRAVTLWKQARLASHSHDHAHHHDHHHHHGHDHHHHDHAHDHDHSHTHAHDHDHEHGWTPARYAVLMLPIVLYFLNLPNSSFSAEKFGRDLAIEVESGGGMMANKGDAFNLGFKELTAAALYADRRADLEGKTGRLSGMFSPISNNDKEFTLYRVKMNCCAADAIPVGVRIVSPDNVTSLDPKEKPWIEVEGQIQFLKVKSQDKYLPVLQLKSKDQVKRIPPRSDYGLD